MRSTEETEKHYFHKELNEEVDRYEERNQVVYVSPDFYLHNFKDDIVYLTDFKWEL